MTGSVRGSAEYNDAGQLRRYYVDGPLYVDEHVLLHEQGADYYYLLGSLYSTAGLMKADGDVIETYGYDAYGAPTAGAPAGLTALGEGPRALRVGVGTAAVNGNGQIAIHVSGNVSECAGGVCTPTPADVACVSRYVQADGTLGDAPVFRTPAEWNGSAGFLRVRGSEIIPDRTYELAADSGMPGMPIRSAPVRAKTMTWGDVQSPPNGDVDLDDVLCVLNGFGSFAACPGADQVPCTGPDGVITLDDILTILSAFGGESYAQACAGVYPPCPSSPVTTMPHNPYYFTGQRLDFNLKTDEGRPLLVLYHYRGRAYGAIDGRFNQRDPAEYVDGMNLYEYARSRPWTFLDPWGLHTINQLIGRMGEKLLIEAIQSNSNYVILHGLGKATAATGPDLIVYNKADDVFEFFDNKAWMRNTASKAPVWMTKFDIKEYEKILQAAIDGGVVPSHLREGFKKALEEARKDPSKVRRLITPFGGRLTGIGKALVQKGIQFVDANAVRTGSRAAAGKALCLLPVAAAALEVLGNPSTAYAATIPTPEAVYLDTIGTRLEAIRMGEPDYVLDDTLTLRSDFIGRGILVWKEHSSWIVGPYDTLEWSENLSESDLDYVNEKIGMTEMVDRLQLGVEAWGRSIPFSWD